MSKIVLALLSLALLKSVDANEVSCERVEDFNYYSRGNKKTCFLDQYTIINETDTKIIYPQGHSMKGLDFDQNKKIEYLPVDIQKSFPNLVVIMARSCSIKEISKQNLAGLHALEYLVLESNQIDKIPKSAFEDLTALIHLSLLSNKIKSVNGEAFGTLTNLQYVSLGSNECINREFTPRQIPSLRDEVSKKCAFEEEED